MNLHESLSTPTCRAALLARPPGRPALDQDEPFVAVRRPGNGRPADVARRILATTWQSWRQPVPAGRNLTIVAGGQA